MAKATRQQPIPGLVRQLLLRAEKAAVAELDLHQERLSRLQGGNSTEFFLA